MDLINSIVPNVSWLYQGTIKKMDVIYTHGEKKLIV